MLARLGFKLEPHYNAGDIEPRIWHHFSSAMLVAHRQNENTQTELIKIEAILAKIDIKAIVLKGAAYSITKMPVHLGRTYSDIDLLVDKKQLKLFENELWFNGFLSAKDDDYDKQYYRQWMHEIPPLQHIKRKTVLDVHHNILPLTGSTTVDIGKLTENQVAIDGFSQLTTLSPEALILHSATHLFHEGEFEKGLTDLIDLEMLLHDYLANNDDLSQLISLAEHTGLGQSLYLAINQVTRVFNKQFKQEDLNNLSKFAPTKLRSAVLNHCFEYIFTPYHSSCDSWQKQLAATILYWRGHLLRMPLGLLIPHLCRKTIKQFSTSFNKQEKQTPEL